MSFSVEKTRDMTYYRVDKILPLRGKTKVAEKKVFLYVDLAGWSEWETKNPETSSIALAWYVNFIQKVISKSGAFINNNLLLSRSRPIPRTTQVKGSSAI